MPEAYFRFSGSQGIIGRLRMARLGLFCGLLLVAATLVLGAASLHGARASAGDYTVTMDGPQSITIDPCCVPAKFPFTVTVSYVGPPLDPPPAEAQTRLTIHLTEFTHSMESQFSDGGNGVSDCQTDYVPTGHCGPERTDFSCTLHLTQEHLSTTMS